MKRIIPVLFGFFFLLTACSGPTSKKVVKVALDPTFFPMELLGREPQVLAFCNELLQEMSRHSKYRFERIGMRWDDLLDGLDTDQYDAVISSVYPYVFNLEKYTFSNPVLLSGPVLVAKIKGPIHGFKNLKDMEVGVLDDDSEQLLIEVAPSVLVRRETSMADIMLKIMIGQLDAGFVDVIPALGYVNDLYANSLMIVTASLSEQGLRYLVLNKHQKQIMRPIEKALYKIKKSGKLVQLQEKWKIAS